MAYVTLIYGGDKYLDGVILTGLGLRKQNTKYKLICMITEDCKHLIDIINIIYDKVIIVPYITFIKKFDSDIIINDIIFNSTFIDTCTKFNIFNKKLLNYDKIIFVDCYLIPIKNFDKLFEYNTPAGWIEFKKNNKICWNEWNIQPNTLINKKINDLTKYDSSSINGGLILIEPNNDVYNDIILTLQNQEIFNKKFKGMYNIYTNLFINNKYMSEQDFLTVYMNNWHYISGLYNAWGNDKIHVNGIHMAGLHRYENNKQVNYKTWEYQKTDDNAYNFHTNLTYIYGIQKYPMLKKYILKNLYILINNELVKFNEIKNINDLSPTQILLYTLFS
jgi:alpha-N-acetylglucosamine transferase